MYTVYDEYIIIFYSMLINVNNNPYICGYIIICIHRLLFKL